MCLPLSMESNNRQPYTINGVNYVFDLDAWRRERTYQEAREAEMANRIAPVHQGVLGQVLSMNADSRPEWVTYTPQNPVHIYFGQGLNIQNNHPFPHPDWKPKNISQLATIKHGKS